MFFLWLLVRWPKWLGRSNSITTMAAQSQNHRSNHHYSHHYNNSSPDNELGKRCDGADWSGGGVEVREGGDGGEGNGGGVEVRDVRKGGLGGVMKEWRWGGGGLGGYRKVREVS